MTAKIRSITSSGTFSWNRSDIELTNHIVGFFVRSGLRKAVSPAMPILPVQTYPPLDGCTVP
jgi:hypothetical protein